MKIILLGAPGAGKGTVATRLVDEKGMLQISTGDLFRAAIRGETALGKEISSIVETGALVPDEVTTKVVKEHLDTLPKETSYILDGYPRSLGQANDLKEFSSIDLVILFEMPEEKLLARLTGRRMCKNCGKSYHIEFVPPKKEGICDSCEGELFTRKDDTVESVKTRLKAYHESTAPLIDFYKKEGLLSSISADQSPKDVYRDVLKLF